MQTDENQGSSAAAEDPAMAEMQKLEGTWQLISAVSDGKETPPEVVQKIRVVIRGGKHTVYFEDEPSVEEIPFTINPAADPKTTADKLPDGRTIRGIYRLDGNLLTSCVSEPETECPTEFVSRPGSGRALRVFRRVGP